VFSSTHRELELQGYHCNNVICRRRINNLGCTFKRDRKEIWKKDGKEKIIAIPVFQQMFCLLV
jgi:hypothetical protein